MRSKHVAPGIRCYGKSTYTVQWAFIIVIITISFSFEAYRHLDEKRASRNFKVGEVHIIEELIVCGSFYKGSLCELAGLNFWDSGEFKFSSGNRLFVIPKIFPVP